MSGVASLMPHSGRRVKDLTQDFRNFPTLPTVGKPTGVQAWDCLQSGVVFEADPASLTVKSGRVDSSVILYADLRNGTSRFAISALRDLPRVQGMGVAPCSDAVFSTDWMNRVFAFMVAAHVCYFCLRVMWRWNAANLWRIVARMAVIICFCKGNRPCAAA